MALTIAAGKLCQPTHGRSASGRLLPLLLHVEAWLDRRRSRRALDGLTDEALKDIGLARADLGRADPGSSWQDLIRPPVRR